MFLRKYLLPFQLSLSELMLNFGVRTNSLRFPICPSKTAIELCKEKPIAIEKNVKNIPIYFRKRGKSLISCHQLQISSQSFPFFESRDIWQDTSGVPPSWLKLHRETCFLNVSRVLHFFSHEICTLNSKNS